MRVFVAIPAYDGKISTETMDALLGEQAIALAQGDVLDVRVLPGCSSIPSARNVLTHDFKASEADRLVFIDSDIAWKPGDLLRMAALPHQIVGGAYRMKRAEEAYVIRWDEAAGELWADQHGAMRVAGLGCGFLAISREALEQIEVTLPYRTYADGERIIYAHFDMPYADGTMWGEDLRFCHLAKVAGVPVHVLPELELTHVAAPGFAFTGRLGDWLRSRLTTDHPKRTEDAAVS